MEHSERDRHLPEDVTGLPLADHALDAVDDPEHLEPALEDAEQRARVTLVHGELAGNERDVRHHPGEPLAFGRLEVHEHGDAADLLCRHHETASATPLRLGRFIHDHVVRLRSFVQKLGKRHDRDYRTVRYCGRSEPHLLLA